MTTQMLSGDYELDSYADYVTVSQDGRYLAATGYPTRLWEIAPDGQLTELWAEEENAYAVAIAPDNQLLVAGLGGNYYLDRTTPNMALNGALRLFNMQNQQLLHLLSPQTMQSTAVVFTPNGRFLLSGSLDGVIRLWGVP
jgi:WD40 repeat protein